MSEYKPDFGAAFWSQNLSEVDAELVRLASICNLRLLDPGVLQRVLDNDASVCGTSNEIAFKKLRNVLMMHYAVRTRAAAALGEGQTQLMINGIVEELAKKFGDRLGTPAGSTTPRR